MSTQAVLARIRDALAHRISLPELITSLDDYAQLATAPAGLEVELQRIHDDVRLSPYETQVFLAVLYHLRSLLPTASIITHWFELVLQPALQEPNLPLSAVDQASDLVVLALEPYDEEPPQSKTATFRRRLLDLYLLDAFNDASGDDVISKSELDKSGRARKDQWKTNLEKLLLKHGIKHPKDFMTELHFQFDTPTCRLQIFMLLNLFTSMPEFQPSTLKLASHPLMSRLLLSLTVDNSSTLCSVGLTFLVKILPLFAVHASELLKNMLPQLLVILSRIICWKERGLPSPDTDASLVEPSEWKPLVVDPELGWNRLDATFYAAAATPPSPHRYFTFLYYLFPCNLLRFLRKPLEFTQDLDYPSPFTQDWKDILNVKELRDKAENLLKTHQCHPLIMWRDAAEELSKRNFWANYDIARITSEAMMLDSTNIALAIRARAVEEGTLETHSTSDVDSVVDDAASINMGAPFAVPRISLQEMVATSVALKSGLNIEITNPTTQWPSSMFVHTPSEDSSRPPSILSSRSRSSDEIPPHITQAIASLQREVVLLRTELNFETWLSRENVQHIGRLYRDRIVAHGVEVERQGLYNKLRNYRQQVTALESELKEHKQQASEAKSKSADWNNELKNKLQNLREDKKTWAKEAAALRQEAKQAKALYDGQEALLVDANNRIFDLETRRKKTEHKIDRLRDYERQIDQHVKIQQLWESDFQKFNSQKDQVEDVTTQMQQMRIQMESLVANQKDLEEQNRKLRHELSTRGSERTRPVKAADPSKMLSAMAAEQTALKKTNEDLRKSNTEQSEMIEELQAMVEVLSAGQRDT